jgi:anti-anti-sigma regulatory factor
VQVRNELVDIVVDVDDERIRVRPVGALCLVTTPMLRGVLDGVLAVRADVVEVDLSATTLLSSVAVDVLDETAALLAVDDRRLLLTGARGLVQRVLDLLRVEQRVAAD